MSIPLAGRQPVRPSGRLLNQGQIESEILRLADRLEESTDLLGQQLERAANDEVAWKLAESVSLLKSTLKSEGQRKAEALQIGSERYQAFRIADARANATTELCRTLRASLSALQTLSANVRGQS